MATVSLPEPEPKGVPVLENGARMTQKEFHRLYKDMPEDFTAELIEGTVYVAAGLKLPHGTNHLPLGTLLFLYEGSTPGVQSGDNATVILGEEGEPQPDLFLRVLPEFGGRSRTTPDEFIQGGPELVAEIAASSRSIDLYGKRRDYARYGVLEYLVLCVRERRLRWFDLPAGRELSPDSDGVFRVRAFPGLWINGPALIAKDAGHLVATLQEGLATPEHAAFVARLAAAKKPAARKKPRRRK